MSPDKIAMLELTKDDQDLLLYAAAADFCEEEGRHPEAKAWRMLAEGTVAAVNDPREEITGGLHCDLLVPPECRGVPIHEDFDYILDRYKKTNESKHYRKLLSRHIGKNRRSFSSWLKAFSFLVNGLEY